MEIVSEWQRVLKNLTSCQYTGQTGQISKLFDNFLYYVRNVLKMSYYCVIFIFFNNIAVIQKMFPILPAGKNGTSLTSWECL